MQAAAVAVAVRKSILPGPEERMMHGQHNAHKQRLIRFAQTCLLLAGNCPQANLSCCIRPWLC